MEVDGGDDDDVAGAALVAAGHADSDSADAGGEATDEEEGILEALLGEPMDRTEFIFNLPLSDGPHTDSQRGLVNDLLSITTFVVSV